MKNYNEELHAEVISYIQKNNLTDAAFARKAGFATATISQYLNKKYPASVRAIEEKLTRVLRDEEDRLNLFEFALPFVETTAWNRYHEVARCTQLYKEFNVIIAHYGYGKTQSATQYQKMYPDTLVFSARRSVTAKTLFRELHKIVCKGGQGILDNMFTDIVSSLEGTDRFIIIDEAEKLPLPALDMIRSLQDAAKIGVLLQGAPELIANMRGARGELGYIYDRVSLCVELPPLSITDVDQLVSISMKDQASPGIAQAILDHSRGNARKVRNLIKQSLRIAIEVMGGIKVDKDVIEKAREVLIK